MINYNFLLPLSSLFRVTATDADWSEQFGSVYYWITDGNTDNHFRINQLDGTVYLARNVDYEDIKSYILTVCIAIIRTW